MHGGFFRNLMILNKPDNPTIFKSGAPPYPLSLKLKQFLRDLELPISKTLIKAKPQQQTNEESLMCRTG